MIQMDFKQLRVKNDFDQVLNDSQSEMQVVFKHSTRCPVSARARKVVEEVFGENKPNVGWSWINVITDRAFSREVADQIEVQHESPQLLILKMGKVIAHISHSKIKKETVEELLAL